jgi:predicted hydrolase (HD superfamily)
MNEFEIKEANIASTENAINTRNDRIEHAVIAIAALAGPLIASALITKGVTHNFTEKAKSAWNSPGVKEEIKHLKSVGRAFMAPPPRRKI